VPGLTGVLAESEARFSGSIHPRVRIVAPGPVVLRLTSAAVKLAFGLLNAIRSVTRGAPLIRTLSSSGCVA